MIILPNTFYNLNDYLLLMETTPKIDISPILYVLLMVVVFALSI